MYKQSAMGLQRRKQAIFLAGKKVIIKYITFSLDLEKKISRGEKRQTENAGVTVSMHKDQKALKICGVGAGLVA